MKRSLIAMLGLCTALHGYAASPRMDVRSIARDFATFWDATQGLSEAERVAAFKVQIAARFPEFYGVERYAGQRTQAQQDELIRRTLAGFGSRREAYLAKVDKFEADLPRHVATFSAAFPDFAPKVSTYFLHSLGEMDGDSRVLAGQAYLIFGADLMSALHGDGDEAAFFHHELFHIYQFAQPSYCDDGRIWQRLWTEGLANHVSKVLNPAATDQEMLLDFPAGSANRVRGRFYDSLVQLEQVLDSTDAQQHANLFQMNGRSEGGLEPRRGYFLGYQIAGELGKTRSPAELLKLSCAAVRPLIGSAISSLKVRSQPQVHMP